MAAPRKTSSSTKSPKTDDEAPPAKKSAGMSARMTAKVSPLRGTAVADYIATKMSGWQAEVAREIVELFATAAPESSAAIKWGQPVFEFNGPVAYMRSAKAHLTFGFWRGADLEDPAGVLEGDGDRMKHVKIVDRAGFDRAQAERWIRHAVRLNRELGNPARRGK